MDIVLVTGMSGAGKTVVGNVLEDFGYYCIDNIPVPLIAPFIELYLKQNGKNRKIALVVDVRGCEDFTQLLDVLGEIRQKNGDECKTIYLDASSPVLINRYKESRHIHPLVLSKHLTLAAAIEEERRILTPVRKTADCVLDTSKLSLSLCRERVIAFISGDSSPVLGISCVSFGFKHGIPSDSDLLFDVRCFPNPYYVEELKNHTGLERCVSDYVMSFSSTRDFTEKLFSLIDSLLPLYLEDGRSHLTISIGCTGGRHRSVAIVEALAKHLEENPICSVIVSHRDIQK